MIALTSLKAIEKIRERLPAFRDKLLLVDSVKRRAGSFDIYLADVSDPDDVANLFYLRDKFPQKTRVALIPSQYQQVEMLLSLRLAHRFQKLTISEEEMSLMIDQVSQLQSLVMNVDVLEAVHRLGSLPRLPGTYTRIETCLLKPSSAMKQVANIVEKDLPVASKVLQLANSPIFHSGSSVNNIQQALTIIGINNLKAIVLMISLFSDLASSGIKYDFTDFFSHSFLTGQCCRLISAYENQPQWQQDKLFLAGLLHDIGIILFLHSGSLIYEEIFSRSHSDHINLLVEEKKTFGIDHTELGAYTSRLWGFPDFVTESILTSHSEENDLPLESQIVAAADSILQNYLFNGRGEGAASYPPSPQWITECDKILKSGS